MAAAPTGVNDWFIYKIDSPSNRVYIGLTNNPQRRQKDYEKISCKNQVALYNSLLKYGFNAHNFTIIDTFNSDYNYALGKEMYWIRSYMSNYSKWPECRGLNLTDGGRGSLGRKMSDETKEKLRKANLGKKYSEETKRKLSASRKGKKINRIWTEDEKKKMSEKKIALNYKHSDEIKEIIRKAALGNTHCLGKKQSQETIAKRAAKLVGNKHRLGIKLSDEHKKKISQSNTGRVVSEETRKKLKEANKDKQGKIIIQSDLDGTFIKEFISIRQASKETDISRHSIKKILNKMTKKPKIYIFKYKNK